MFKEERKESLFDWSMLGDLKEGRPNLGNSMNVDVYRLMQFTLKRYSNSIFWGSSHRQGFF